MGDILPDGTISGYSAKCSICGQTISTNIQGNPLEKHNCDLNKLKTMSVHSPEIEKPKLIDYAALQDALQTLREQTAIIQKLKDEIAARNETENNTNFIGGDWIKNQWAKDTQHKIIYCEVLEDALKVAILKFAQKYGKI